MQLSRASRTYDTIIYGRTLSGLRFSPDGKRTAYVAYHNNGRFVVTDGREGTKYGHILARDNEGEEPSGMVFSPDSAHLAYVALKGGKQCVVADTVESACYDAVDPLSLIYTPDSRHLVYVAQRKGKKFVVVDGTAGKEYDAFLPYGRVTLENAGVIRALARRGDELLRVCISIR